MYHFIETNHKNIKIWLEARIRRQGLITGDKAIPCSPFHTVFKVQKDQSENILKCDNCHPLHSSLDY